MSTFALLKRVVRHLLPEPGLTLLWVQKNPTSWLCSNLPDEAIRISDTGQYSSFEKIAAGINSRGTQPLWDGYRAAYEKDSTVPWANASMQRLPDQVRTQPQMGRLFAKIAANIKPDLIVEIGTAFGVSAMYWASGLQASGRGRLVTFDPNPTWHGIAAEHLAGFGPTVETVLGTFEENIDARLMGQKISIAFVDAIHTDSFVSAQIEMLLLRAAPNAIIVLDDITFSDDMRACWKKWAGDARILSSVSVDDRVGILEFR